MRLKLRLALLRLELARDRGRRVGKNRTPLPKVTLPKMRELKDVAQRQES
jgi:hypothetical protein